MFYFCRYIGRGLFIDSPTVCMQRANWNILLPNELLSDRHKEEDLSKFSAFLIFYDILLFGVGMILTTPCAVFGSRDELFSKNRDRSKVSSSYLAYISKQLSAFSRREQDKWIAALIIEPGKNILPGPSYFAL